MQYNLVLTKHPEIILATRKESPIPPSEESLTPDEMKELVEAGINTDIIMHAQMMMDFQDDLKAKDFKYQLGILAELFYKIGNSRMFKHCMNLNMKAIDKYTTTPKFGEMLMKHTTLIKNNANLLTDTIDLG